MINQTYIKSNSWSQVVNPAYALNNLSDEREVRISTYPHHVGGEVETTSNYVCLQFANLKCFESVECQYENQGVIFRNCIAIQPSNPAFPMKSGMLVLMGSPQSGLLEASFVDPVQGVKALITSSQRLVLSAYDRDRQLLAQTILPAANLANSDSSVPPSVLLSVQADDIHRVTFCAFDGQFTVEEFSFCV
jgi:hypothetical protein